LRLRPVGREPAARGDRPPAGRPPAGRRLAPAPRAVPRRPVATRAACTPPCAVRGALRTAVGISGGLAPAPANKARPDPRGCAALAAERALLRARAMQRLLRLRPLLFASACAIAALGCAGELGPVDEGEEPGQPDGGTGGGGDPEDPGDETPDAGGDDGPAIAMDELVVQSQVEPYRGDQPDLPGDAAVEMVQRALAEEGFDVTGDGWYGNETASVYADGQAGLGYSGPRAH